jgi:hypothetical protein
MKAWFESATKTVARIEVRKRCECHEFLYKKSFADTYFYLFEGLGINSLILPVASPHARGSPDLLDVEGCLIS